MASPKEIWNAYKKSVDAALSDIGNTRAGQTISGGAKNSLAADVNTAANIYDLTQRGRDTMMSGYISDSAFSLNQAKRALAQLEREGASAYEIENQQTVVNSLQRQYDAMSMAGAVQRGATQATYQLADDIKNSATASIDKAKSGLGAVGNTAVDVGAALTEMGLDKAKSALLIGGLGPDYDKDNILKKLSDYLKIIPLTGRNYGKNSQLARQDGADIKGATIYGATTAITDAAIEKAFDGLSGQYGKAWAEKAADNFAKLFKSEEMQNLAKAGFNDASEGLLESLATDLADYLLKITYTDKNSRQINTKTEWGRVGRNILINTIVGILSGDTVWKDE